VLICNTTIQHKTKEIPLRDFGCQITHFCKITFDNTDTARPVVCSFFYHGQHPQWAKAPSLSRIHDHTQTHHIR